jgi:hypothetical protein
MEVVEALEEDGVQEILMTLALEILHHLKEYVGALVEWEETLFYQMELQVKSYTIICFFVHLACLNIKECIYLHDSCFAI